MARRNQILFGLLIAQLLLVVLLFWPRAAGTATGGALFAGTMPADVSAVTVADGAATLRLVWDGAQWVLPEAGDFPVLSANVTRLLSGVLAIDTSRLVASTPASRARLKVADDDFVRRVELELASGDRQVLLIGTSPNANATHVRRGDQDAIYLAPGSLAADARSDLAAWIDTQVLALPPGEISGLTVQNRAGSFTLTRDGAGTWSLAGLQPGETLDQAAADALVGRLAGVTMARPLGREGAPADGLDQPLATLTITSQPAGGSVATVTLKVGALDAATNTYAAEASTSAYVVAVPSFQLDDFVANGRADLLQALPATTAPLTGTQGITTTGIFTP